MTRQLALAFACTIVLLPVGWMAWTLPIAAISIPLGEEDDCPNHSATGFELDSVRRVSPTLIVCEYGRGWPL